MHSRIDLMKAITFTEYGASEVLKINEINKKQPR